MFRWLLLPLLVLAVHAQEYEGKTLVKPSLIADTTAVVPGQKFEIGLLLEMAPKWHTYWIFGGDAGFPTTIEWTLPAGFKAGPIQWPLPVREFLPGDIESYAYYDQVLLITTIEVPADLNEKSITMKAKVDWLVCEDICLPGSADLEITLPVSTEAAPAHQELFASFRNQQPSDGPPPYKLAWKSGPGETTLTVTGLESVTAVDLFPLPYDGQQVGHPKNSAVTNGEATLEIPAEGPVRGVLVVETAEGRKGWNVSSGAPPPPPSAAPATSGSSAPTPPALWYAILCGLLGGLILNVMPCVLPVISLKIFGFVKQAGNHPERILRHGLAFVAGIFVFFLAIGLLIIFINSRGGGAGWGFQFQNPWFNAVMCSLIFLFALNLFGVFEIILPGKATTALETASSREGYLGSFFQGAFSTLLATSCSAPFLGTALGFAFGQPALTVLVIFTAVATGMSAPYLLLSAKPAWMKMLPKPGLWMERVKQFMGFPLIGTLIWLLDVVGGQKGTEGVIWLSCFLLGLALAAWIYGTFCGPVTKPASRALAMILALVVAVGSGWYFLGIKYTQSAGPAPQGFAMALEDLRTKGQPVFVDFTADWCINCKVYEKTVLDAPAVREAFKKHDVVLLKADWTNPDPEIEAALKSFGRAAVPFYVLYPANQAEPIILGDFITQQSVIDALARAR
jgi:thiol:disulfide interchange protein